MTAKRTSLDKDKIKVLLLESVHPSAVEAFKGEGYTNIEAHAGSLPERELAERLRGAHIVGVRSRTRLTADALAGADRLMAIGCFSVGTDQIDLVAAEERGIPVFNAPYSNTRSVAELVLAEVILLSRGIAERNAAAHRGKWLKTVGGATEVRGKTLGIVGYGHIGTQVGVLAEALGMRVLYYDIEPKLGLGNAARVTSLDELLAQSDVVTLHVPDTR
ncbi:MAG TPA: NAD(P)-dependent oxidoreductase, partial [Candidatus Limnocylindria bacterium]|nr:NAD(P)-dependent oxidoreductase [Candidatus Limnocylindria bacterium]